MSETTAIPGLAQRIAELQKASGMSVDAFAQLHGAKRSAQFQYQGGQSVPDLHYLLRLAKTQGVTLHWLVFGDAVTDGGLTTDERSVVERWRGLPSKVRQTVDDVLLLAWLAADSRRQYEPAPAPADAARAYDVAPPAAPMQLHEPAPRRRTAAKKAG